MEAIIKDGTLVIKLNGRVDSGNAPEVEEQIMKACADNEHEKVVLDVQELEYISSAGLRVVLKLKKAENTAEVCYCASS